MSLEDELEVAKRIDSIVDRYAAMIIERGKEAGFQTDDMEHFLSTFAISEAKFVLKMMIPSKDPVTCLIVSQCLVAMLMLYSGKMGTEDDIMNKFAHDSGFSESFSGSDEIDDLAGFLQDKQNKKAAKYKTMKQGDKEYKIADLGDVTKNISMN